MLQKRRRRQNWRRSVLKIILPMRPDPPYDHGSDNTYDQKNCARPSDPMNKQRQTLPKDISEGSYNN
jgi:hypothetical protein